MLGTLASRLTDQLYLHCSLDPRKKAVYTYGIQLSLSTLASMCSIVLLGILLGDALSAFLFLGVFFFLRLFAGGYHASTYARCFLLTNSVYLMVYLFGKGLLYFRFFILLPIITVVSCMVIVILAPIRNKHHPLSEPTYEKNRRIARALAIIEGSICLALSIWETAYPCLSVLVMSLAAIAVMMLITIKQKGDVHT